MCLGSQCLGSHTFLIHVFPRCRTYSSNSLAAQGFQRDVYRLYSKIETENLIKTDNCENCVRKTRLFHWAVFRWAICVCGCSGPSALRNIAASAYIVFESCGLKDGPIFASTSARLNLKSATSISRSRWSAATTLAVTVATSYSNIGVVYDSQGKYEVALGKHMKSLDIKIKVVGDEHCS